MDPRIEINKTVNEVETMLVEYEAQRSMMIQESAAGALLVLIPKLIKLILMIVNKILYLLAIPLVNALLFKTKNIRKTGSSVLSGESSIKEVVSSANLNNVRSAVVSAAKGDVAGFVEELDKSLEDVQAKHVSKISKENAEDKNIYETLGQRNMEIIDDINKTMREKLKVVQFIDPKQLKILRDSLEMMKDENLVHLTFDYIAGFDYETLNKFEEVNHRYDLVYLEKYLKFVEGLVSSLEEGNDISLVDTVRQDTSDNRKIFTSYFLECVAKMKPIEDWLPKDLFQNHFRLNDGKVLSNLKVNTDYGDFKYLIDQGKMKHGPIIEMLKEAGDDLDNLNAMSTRSYAFYSGHIKNVNNSNEIEERRKYIDDKLKQMQERVEKLNPESIGYGLEHSYVEALLEFLRNDLSNILYTIKHAKMSYLDNYEGMIEVIKTMSEEIAGSYMYLIIDDIIKNPNIYKVTEDGLKIIVTKFKELGGKA